MTKFDTIREAAKWCHIAPENIGQCCNGKSEYSGTHPKTNEVLFWCFAKDLTKETIQHYFELKEKYKNKRTNKIKRVQQFDLNNNFINEYANCTEAALQVFQDYNKHKGISRCAAGNRKTAYGYIWKYINTDK